MFKKQKGITLIALVITIIVLLILAGVSINLVLGNNGVLNQASNAVDVNKEATAKEEVSMAWGSCETRYWSEKAQNASKTRTDFFTEANLNADLIGKGTVSDLTYTENGTSTLTYTPKNSSIAYELQIDSAGNVTSVGETEAPEIPVPPTPPEESNNGPTVSVNGEKVELTEENLGQYLGKVVNYTPSGTVSASTSTTYRLFYVDFENKYGDGEGTIYLKADYPSSTTTLTLASSASEDNKYLQLNPTWKNKSGATTTLSVSNIKAVAWLMEPSNWNNLKQTSLGESVNYVVGAPSLDMYVDSYNTYLEKYPATNNNAGTTAKQLITDYAISGHSAQGYLIGLAPNDYSNGNGEYTATNTLMPSSVCSGMYNPGSSKWYWLASPSASSADYVMNVYGNASNVSCYYYTSYYALCPLVSLESTVQGLVLSN